MDGFDVSFRQMRELVVEPNVVVHEWALGSLFRKSQIRFPVQKFLLVHGFQWIMQTADFRSLCFLGLLLDLDDGDSPFLRNVDKLLPDYMVSHPRRQ
jgi:hypothetical protein